MRITSTICKVALARKVHNAHVYNVDVMRMCIKKLALMAPRGIFCFLVCKWVYMYADTVDNMQAVLHM